MLIKDDDVVLVSQRCTAHSTRVHITHDRILRGEQPHCHWRQRIRTPSCTSIVRSRRNSALNRTLPPRRAPVEPRFDPTFLRDSVLPDATERRRSVLRCSSRSMVSDSRSGLAVKVRGHPGNRTGRTGGCPNTTGNKLTRDYPGSRFAEASLGLTAGRCCLPRARQNARYSLQNNDRLSGSEAELDFESAVRAAGRVRSVAAWIAAACSVMDAQSVGRSWWWGWIAM